MRLHVRHNLRIEEVDGTTIVLDPSGAEVHRVTGDAAEALHLVRQGIDNASLPARLVPALASLIDAGVVSTSDWSRRKLLLAGGAATAGITTFVLAAPAAASSPGTTTTTSSTSTTSTTTTTTVPCFATNTPAVFDASGTFTAKAGAAYDVRVHAWGAGGGSGRDGTKDGAGGGGGAYSNALVSVSGCTDYTVVVGTGGAQAVNTTVGNNGGFSSFALGATVHVKALGGTGAYDEGGKGGAFSVGIGGSTTGAVGEVKFAGGNGSPGAGGKNGAGGGGGGSGGSTGAGGTGGITAGGTAGTGGRTGAPGGDGGADGAVGMSGVAVLNHGSGGGGGGSGNGGGVGGSGANGRVRIVEI